MIYCIALIDPSILLSPMFDEWEDIDTKSSQVSEVDVGGYEPQQNFAEEEEVGLPRQSLE